MADLRERMRANPAAGWRIGDIEKVCQAAGVSCEPPTGGGSHYKVYHATQRNILSVPSRRPIKPVYIRKLVQFLDAVKAP